MWLSGRAPGWDARGPGFDVRGKEKVKEKSHLYVQSGNCRKKEEKLCDGRE
jgi:hypothetical protein